MEKTKQLTTTAFLVAIAAVLGLGVYILPFLQSFLFAVAVPIIVIAVKYDLKTQVMGLLALTIIMATLNPLYAMILLLFIGPLSVVQGMWISKKKSTSEVIFFGALAFAFGLLSLLYLSKMMFSVDLIALLDHYTTIMVDELKSIYGSTELLENQDMQTFLSSLDQIKSYVLLLIPSFIILFSFVSSAASYALSNTILRRTGTLTEKTYFKDFRIDKSRRLLVMVVMLIVTLVSILDNNNMEYYIINFTSLLLLIFQINGLALIWFLTEKHPNQKALRIITIILFFIAPFVGILQLLVRYGLGVLGLLDMYVDFRKKIQDNPKS